MKELRPGTEKYAFLVENYQGFNRFGSRPFFLIGSLGYKTMQKLTKLINTSQTQGSLLGVLH